MIEHKQLLDVKSQIKIKLIKNLGLRSHSYKSVSASHHHIPISFSTLYHLVLLPNLGNHQNSYMTSEILKNNKFDIDGYLLCMV